MIRATDFYGKPRTAPAVGFYAMQAVTFVFLALLFLSWDFSTLAYLPDESFTRETRNLLFGYWKTPWFYYTSCQFIYEFIPRPGVAPLAAMQVIIAVASAAGLAGIFPRAMAWVCFVIGTHLFGLFLPGGATMDGSATALMFLNLNVAIAPKGCHYEIGRPFTPYAREEKYHWPNFLLVFFLSAYYFAAAANKILDTGFDWPLTATIDGFSLNAIEKSVFLSSWSTSLWFSYILQNYFLATFAGWGIFLMELFCPVILLYPRLIPVFLLPLAGMHMCIWMSHGYGYFVNAAADVLGASQALATRQRIGRRDQPQPILEKQH